MKKSNKERSKIKILIPIFVGLLVILLISAYWLPPVHSRLSWRIDDLVSRIKFSLNPPDKVLFLPTPGQSTITLTPNSGSQTGFPTPLPAEPSATTTPTQGTTPIPSSLSLPGVIYVDQFHRWNYCGPANLAMALKFWGWTGSRDDIAAVVKPGIQDPALDFIAQGKSDKNVMPYELTDYVQNNTAYNVVLRYGGNVDLVKRLIAAGFPVVAEKGYYEADYTGKVGWMGHYQFITGYDDASQTLIVQDTYNDGPNFHIPYDKFANGWRSFDYIFFIIYPPERESEVFSVLGPWLDPQWSYQYALDVNEQDIPSLNGIDLYFAWFSKGTSLVKLGRYVEAAQAYDMAFNLYSSLGTDNQQRPFRMMWYQTGPFMAYYNSGRYGDVINLADVTLDTVSPPTLEESFYWKGMAEYALGQTAAAIDDFKEAVKLNKNFSAGLQILAKLGVTP